MESFIHRLLNFLLPQKCLGCNKKQVILCRECLKTLPLPDSEGPRNIFAAAHYDYEITRRAVWLLKYRGIKQLAEPLAELINTRCFSVKHRVFYFDKSEWIIIPIPLSSKRLRERGYNQAELIAKHLLDKIKTSDVEIKNIGCLTDVLYKKFHTESQVNVKDREKRLKNMKGSFGIKNPELIKNKNIILIDDVSTTGATISEAEKTLLKAGAKKIIAMVVAKG